MRLFDLIMFIIAVVCFAAAAYLASRPATSNGRVVGTRWALFLALGLLAWVLVPFVSVVNSYS